MSGIEVKINGRSFVVSKNKIILEVCQDHGFDIPTLCYHKDISSYGGCRLCMVEVIKAGKSRLVASCNYYVEENIEIFTASERVLKFRRLIIELLMGIMPYSEKIQQLAKEYKVVQNRFKSDISECILCGLCVRYCEEVKKENVLGFLGRGIDTQLTVVPTTAYFEKCQDCAECFSLCPTGVLPSNFGLASVEKLMGNKTDK